MSLCTTCGLDLESGTRVELDDDLMPEAPTGKSGTPLDIAIFGGICLLASLILAFGATVRGAGWEYFLPICIFGSFGSIQFLRGRSTRLLLTALSLGAMINVVALIAMPIVEANREPIIVRRAAVEHPDAADVAIGSVADQLDARRLSWGLALLLAYPASAVYLMSPAVRRHCSRRAFA